VAISRRATLRKAFLAPWDPRVEQAWLYALADAQRVHGIAVHHGVRCVNHHHVEVTARGDGLPAFVHRFHRDVSCAVNVLLAMERYDAPRQVFDSRQAHLMHLVDDRAQMRHLLYSHLNPVAAGLVAKPAQMPGRVLGFEDWLRDGVVVKRPDFYFGKSRPEELVLKLSAPLRLLASFGGDLRALVYHLKRLADDGCSALRDARTRPVMGAATLRKMHPWAEPKTMAAAGGRRVPSFKVGALGEHGRELRMRCAREVTGFRGRYSETRMARLRGEDVAYPHGTYGPRVYQAAPVEETPPWDGLLALAGPLTLEEAMGGEPVGPRAERNALIDRVRELQREEAGALIAEEHLDFQAHEARDPREHNLGEERPHAETRHRFAATRDIDDAANHPRRLIIELDRRRALGRGGSDPPL